MAVQPVTGRPIRSCVENCCRTEAKRREAVIWSGSRAACARFHPGRGDLRGVRHHLRTEGETFYTTGDRRLGNPAKRRSVARTGRRACRGGGPSCEPVSLYLHPRGGLLSSGGSAIRRIPSGVDHG